MEIQEKIFKNFILVIITEVVEIISNFLILYILTHIFPPDLYVYYSFSIAFYSFLVIFANFGLGTTIIRNISTLDMNKSEKIKELISGGFFLVIVFSIIPSVLLFLFSNYIEQIYNLPSMAVNLNFISLYLFSSSIIFYFECVFQGIKKYKFYTISKVITNISKLSIVLSSLFLNFPISFILQLFAVSSLVQAITITIFIQLKFKSLSIFMFLKKKKIVRILKFAVFVFFPVLFQYLFSQFNQFILAFHAKPAELAQFIITLIIIQSLSVPLFIFSRFIFPYISSYMQNYEKNRKKIYIAYNYVFKFGLLIMVPLSFYIFCFSENIIIIVFGNQYINIAFYLRYFAFYLNILILDSAGAIFLWASNKPKLVFKLSFFTTTLTIIMSVLLIPFYYTYGAILSIIIPRSIYIIYSVTIVRIKENIKIKKDVAVSILKYIASSIISIISLFFIILIYKLNLSNLLIFIIVSCCFLGEFFLFCLIFKGIKISEISHLFNLTKSLFNFRKKSFSK